MKYLLRIMGAETIFVIESYYLNTVLDKFENMDVFKAGITRKTYKLPYPWDWEVVYEPYLYYHRRGLDSTNFSTFMSTVSMVKCYSVSILVFHAAAISVVTQSWGGLRDDTNNGCVVDYIDISKPLIRTITESNIFYIS